jgi:long-chain acyl-CoA synthetase
MTRDPILDAFDSLASRHPERTLVVSAARAATVDQVDREARTLGTLLAEAKLVPDAVVGLAAANGPAFLAGFLAVRRAGLGVLLLDSKAPDPDLRRTAGQLGAERLLVSHRGWPRGVHDWRLDALAAEPGNPPARIPGGPVIKVTSGSTGLPRGVCASAENVHADEAALFSTMGLRDDDVILASIPMAHSYGFSSVALPALVRGCRVAVPDGWSPLAPLDVARTAGVTFVPTVPAYLQGLVALFRPEAWPRCVRLVVSAGALLPPATAAGFRTAYGQPVHSFYGASECGGICYDREGGAAERGTVGAAVEGVTIRLEPQPGLPEGEGTVIVASAAVADSYLPDADSRLARGQFRTSDRGTWAGGELRLCGRVDGLINVKGKKVDPGEVERVIVELDAVLDVVVIGVPSRPEGNDTVRAVVACLPGTLTATEVVAFCRTRLAEHKVPRSVRLVTEIPRTTRGKIDRQALLALGEAGSRR